MSLPKNLEAKIYFFTTEEGGRKGCISQGYRPILNYNNQNWITSLSYPDVEVVNPGETIRAYVSFLTPEEQVGKISIDTKFKLIEGSKTVGKGVVTRILDLENHAN